MQYNSSFGNVFVVPSGIGWEWLLFIVPPNSEIKYLPLVVVCLQMIASCFDLHFTDCQSFTLILTLQSS